MSDQQPHLQVPLLDLKPQYQALKGEILAAIEKVCAEPALHSRARP